MSSDAPSTQSYAEDAQDAMFDDDDADYLMTNTRQPGLALRDPDSSSTRKAERHDVSIATGGGQNSRLEKLADTTAEQIQSPVKTRSRSGKRAKNPASNFGIAQPNTPAPKRTASTTEQREAPNTVAVVRHTERLGKKRTAAGKVKAGKKAVRPPKEKPLDSNLIENALQTLVPEKRAPEPSMESDDDDDDEFLQSSSSSSSTSGRVRGQPVRGTRKARTKAAMVAQSLAEEALRKKSRKNANPQNASKRHFRQQVNVYRAIRRAQQSNKDMLFPKAPFGRLVREIAQKHKEDLRFQRSAIDALNVASSGLLQDLFQEAQVHADTCGHITLEMVDIDVAAARLMPQHHLLVGTLPAHKRHQLLITGHRYMPYAKPNCVSSDKTHGARRAARLFAIANHEYCDQYKTGGELNPKYDPKKPKTTGPKWIHTENPYAEMLDMVGRDDIKKAVREKENARRRRAAADKARKLSSGSK